MSHAIPKRAIQRIDFITDLCRDRSVLHLGCTNYPFTEASLKDDTLLHSRITSVASETAGFDLSVDGLELLRSRGVTDLYYADLEALDEVEMDRTFDVIIAGEIIEHLNNPGLFLSGIKRFMSPASKLVITTVNAYCAFRLLLYSRNGRRGLEPVHPDHVAYYSASTLRVLIERHDFHISDFQFYDIGNEHRPFGKKLVNLINDAVVWGFPHLADGVIAVCELGRNALPDDPTNEQTKTK